MTSPARRPRLTPWRSVAIVGASIFFVELGIMLTFSFVPALPPVLETLVDSVALVVVVAPVLYFFSLRPILRTLGHLQDAEDTIVQFTHEMERTVVERTRDLALAAEVGRTLASVRDMESLLTQAVELIRARFELDYTQVYFTDMATRALILRAGTGEVGAELLRRQQRLPMGAGSLNGLAVVERRPVIVEDTQASAQFRPNPLLPNIRSEMVVPLVVGEQVVGTLDLQSTRPGALTEASLPAFEAMAGQLAVAIQNAELFGMVEKARAAVETQMRHSARAGWEHFLNAVDRQEYFGYAYTEGQLAPLTAPVLPTTSNRSLLTAPLSVSGAPVGVLQLEGDPEVPWTADEAQVVQAIARQAAQQLENLRLLAEAEDYQRRAEEAVRRLTREGWSAYEEQAAQTGFMYDAHQIAPLAAQPAPWTTPSAPGPELQQRLLVRNEIVGELTVGGLPAVSDEAAELVNAVAEKLSAHLESLRLFEQTQNALARAQALYEVGRDLMASENIGQLLCGVADKAARVLPADRVLVITFDVDERAVRYFARSQAGLEDAANISFDGLWNGLSGWALREGRAALSLKDTLDPREDTAAQQRRRDDNCGAIVVVPLQLRGKVLGTLTIINRPDQRDFSLSDVELMEAMATQVAVALDNRHLFEQTQTALVRTEALYQATAEFTSARSYADVLHVLSERTLLGRASHLTNLGFFDRPWSPHQPPNRYTLVASEMRFAPTLAAPAVRELAFNATPYARGLPSETITHVEDLAADARWADADQPFLPATARARALLFAPLSVRGQLIGVINAFYPQPTLFPESELRQLATLASQAAVALENLRSLEQTQRALVETESLYRASRNLAAASTVPEMLTTVMESVGLAFIDRALVIAFSLDAQGILLDAEVMATWRQTGVAESLPPGSHYPPETFSTFNFFIGAEASFFDDIETDPRLDPLTRASLLQQNLRGVAVLPLWVGGRQLGILVLQSERPHHFVDNETRPFLSLAQQLSVAVENRRLFEQTQAALVEAAQLYNASRRLASAEEVTLMLTAVLESAPIPAISRALLMTLESDASGAPTATRVLAHWHSGRGQPPLAVGQRQALADFIPFQLALTDEPVLFADCRADTRLNESSRALARQRELAALAAFPLWVGGEQTGLLVLEAETPHDFVDNEVRPLRSLAQQLAVAVENRRLFDQTQLALAEQIRVTAQLETVNQVTSVTSTLLEPQALLQTVVDLAKTRFNVYHAHIYVLNDPGDTLVLAAGAGAVGRQMAAEGRRIALNHPHSLVARAGRTRQNAVADDVRRNPDFLPHPLLPETRSELAVPMLVGDTLVGVFDVQANVPDYFTEETQRVQLTLAAQVAIALRNAASFAQITTAREQLEAQARRLTRTGWHDYLDAVERPERLGYAYDLVSVTPLLEAPTANHTHSATAPLVITGETVGAVRVESADQLWSREEADIVNAVAYRLAQHVENLRLLDQAQRYREEAEQAIRRLTQTGWSQYAPAAGALGFVYDQVQVTPAGPPAASLDAALMQPLRVRGEAIGRVLVESEARLNAEDSELVTLISERLSTHLESLRLLDETQRRSQEVQALNRVVTVATSSFNLKTILQTTAQEVGQLLHARNTGIALLEADHKHLVVMADHNADPNEPSAVGVSIPLEGNASSLRVIETKRSLIVSRAQTHPLTATIHDLLRARHTHGLMLVPLLARGEVVGTVGVDTTDPNREFTSAEAALVETFAGQIAGAIENIRLFEETQRRATELETVAKVSATASATLEAELLMAMVVDLTKERFHLYHAHIYLLDETAETLVLTAGAGQVGARMVAEGRHIPLTWEQSLVAQAARRREAIIANDVRSNPDFLPHPLLPETRAELAVPMIVGERTLGVFDVQADRANYFTQEDVRIQTTLAAQIAVALNNALLYSDQAATVTRLRELDHLKSSFLANMSHELRTPLNSILGFTEVILEELDGPLTEQMENDLRIVYKNGQHLLNLINDVLDMAKIESGKLTLNPERFDLTEVLEEVISLTSSLARTKDIELRLQAEVGALEVEADRMRLRQVFINIINNAIKFTENGNITLSAVREENLIRATVRDTGLGIPVDHLESIFHEFTQVDTSTTRKVGGTGLGLPISRHLVEMHGGRLWAESTGVAGEGSAFIVELPLSWPGLTVVEE